MTKFPSPVPIVVTILGAASLFFAGNGALAQQAAAPAVTTATAPEETFSFELGRAVVERETAGSSTYAVTTTRDFHAKETGAKIRLSVVERDGAGSSTHLLTISTGKYKSVAQMTAILADIFRKYLAVPPANQDIGKIGDLKYGGEIHFYAESADALRYDSLTPGAPAQSTHFKRNDIQVFLGILTHPKTAN